MHFTGSIQLGYVKGTKTRGIRPHEEHLYQSMTESNYSHCIIMVH